MQPSTRRVPTRAARQGRSEGKQGVRQENWKAVGRLSSGSGKTVAGGDRGMDRRSGSRETGFGGGPEHGDRGQQGHEGECTNPCVGFQARPYRRRSLAPVLSPCTPCRLPVLRRHVACAVSAASFPAFCPPFERSRPSSFPRLHVLLPAVAALLPAVPCCTVLLFRLRVG